jgi:ABC-2 type transport system permease protein
MLRGFWKLTWVETKVFMREPMGVVSALVVPLLVFILLGRAFGSGQLAAPSALPPPFNVAILAALVIAVSAVMSLVAIISIYREGGILMSLVAIISIYREGGILKRLRATPLSPVTILGAHVVVKLVFTVISLALLVLAGRGFLPGAMDVNLPSFTAALLLSTLSILSLGFVIASVIPTARFAQPIGAAFLYPMIAISGLFFPLELLSPPLRAIAYSLPTTHSVTLMQGIWDGSGWGPHWGSVATLIVVFVACTLLSTRVFRWE